MEVVLPGFPEYVSERIEAPDMAELLTYPWFFNASCEAVERFGSAWQRRLLAAIPWRGTGRWRTVLSKVTVESAHTRSLLSPPRDGFEWHVDGKGEEHEAGDTTWREGSERFWLYEVAATCLTAFNTTPIVVPQAETVENIGDWLKEHAQERLTPQVMAPMRLVEVVNHVHRPTIPAGREFRFVFRVRETNRSVGPVAGSGMITHINQQGLDGRTYTTLERRDGDVIVRGGTFR